MREEKFKNYTKEDFLKLYNKLCDKDILLEIKDAKRAQKSEMIKQAEISNRLKALKSRLSSCSPTEREDLEKTIRKLNILQQSCILDLNTKEDIKEYLDKGIDKLIPLLEDIIYYLVSLEEM